MFLLVGHADGIQFSANVDAERLRLPNDGGLRNRIDDRGPRRFGRAGTVGRLNQATKRAGATLLFPKRNPAGMSIDNFWILEAKSRTKNE